MRKVTDSQLTLGAVHISRITFDLRSRDEIPKLLMGLQYIYCTPEVRDEVFQVLKGIVPKDTDADSGRPGMELWKILVLGTIRLNCNWDYDKLQEIANNHKTLRQMLGHGVFDQDYSYALQTLRDNVSLLTPEILDEINQIVVKAGHKLVCQKKEDEVLRGRCDSFVVETDVHYPTDINLLFDAIRKVITLIAALCSSVGITTWRQGDYNIRKIKKLFRKAQKLKRSTSTQKEKKVERDRVIIEAHKAYITLVSSFLERVKQTIKTLLDNRLVTEEEFSEIESYIKHAERQIDQIKRRVVEGEKIPHSEKVFSIFEEHTEWICKGKAGVPQELGLRVCILEDQHGFVLHHQVMQKETDDQVAVPMIREVKDRYPQLNSCSFDKGFYSPSNKEKLSNLLDTLILSKKGRLSSVDKEIENAELFIEGKRQHSAVESAINALENHGLDRCLDHGIDGFKRYVALAIVARNLQIIGHVVQKSKVHQQKILEGIQRKKQEQKYRYAA